MYYHVQDSVVSLSPFHSPQWRQFTKMNCIRVFSSFFTSGGFSLPHHLRKVTEQWSCFDPICSIHSREILAMEENSILPMCISPFVYRRMYTLKVSTGGSINYSKVWTYGSIAVCYLNLSSMVYLMYIFWGASDSNSCGCWYLPYILVFLEDKSKYIWLWCRHAIP